MAFDITQPIFSNEDKAREHLEEQRWPDGPFCPHCGSTNVHRLEGKSHRAGLIQCNACLQAFTVTIGSVMECSHIPLRKWVLAFYLMNSSKKGISAHQLHRMLGITYKSAWFLAHRVREAMKPANAVPIGGEGKTVEVDETVIGGSKVNRAYAKRAPKKKIVMSLVERGGAVRSFHIAKVTAKTLHMPSSHQRYADWTPERIQRQANEIGPKTSAWYCGLPPRGRAVTPAIRRDPDP
ncbi:MAG: IS1595 family transposase, partial [Rhodoplanes sp.]